MKMSPKLILSRAWFMLQVLSLAFVLHGPKECSAAFTSHHIGTNTKIHKSLKDMHNKQQTSKRHRHSIYAATSPSDTNDASKTPFFANSLGGGVGSFFSSKPSSQKPTSSDSKAASITTRIPLGTLFDSRDYTFETLTNVRGYEWTAKVAEELLDDFIDASRGYLNEYDQDGVDVTHARKPDYELSQIVLVPMEWDTNLYGLGNRYDVFDGQQRLVTLCLIFAALRESLANDEGMEETVVELANMLKPPKVRKEDVVRIELHKRDNIILAQILKNETSEVDSIKDKDKKKLTRANRRILENYRRFTSRIQDLSSDERVQLLDFMVENVYLLVCVPETPIIARNLVTAQGKGMDNESIDDFKGLVCFRYTKDEIKMYETFDNWDNLASTLDLDNGCVGRGTVSDACLLRATTLLRTKIRKRENLLSLERWLRRDVIQNKSEGNAFFKTKIEPASLTLGQYRTGEFNLFNFYSRRSKGGKVWTSIAMRLNFLRLMTTTVTSVKDLEMVILDLLLRASGEGEDGGKMSLQELDQQLHGLEVLALWMALSKPSVSKRYEKCFEFLDAIENGENDANLISEQEKSMIREGLVVSEFGSTAAGKRIAVAIMKRINCHVQAENGGDERLIESMADQHLELILPVKGTKKAWGKSWPDAEEKDKWVNRIGNFAIVADKPTVAESKMPFSTKKERFKDEDWPLTAGLAEFEEWDSNSLIKNLANIVNLSDKVFSL